ncbi:hypothetical protein INT45_006845 [Circinella minor]|uniref:Zn(2)-C6 fungal-type domain-containing protein n=1 Tax=Circinella minor TaxID=1195481 RepID=A0A8H7VDK4_9FUNG|nr:hypothetical protein INT45_006845 [Circinella minor]
MLTPLQFQKYGENDDKEKKPTTIVSATTSIHVAPIACTSCQIRNVSCDRIKPTCRECIQHSLQCQYNYNENGMTTTTITATSSSNSTTTTAALLTESTIRDPNQLREIETRLKKMETQLTARTQSSSSTSIVPLQQVQKKQTNQHSSTIVKKKPTPRFGLEPVTGGLCIETEINEAHHFIKLLFSTIHVEKIQHIAHNVFSGRLSSSMDDDDTKTFSSLTITRNHHNNNNPLLADIKNKPLDVLLNDLLARNDDPVEQQWLNMIINTQHHRCMIFYQRVDSKYFANTDYLRQHPNDEQQRTRELLLAMALRAYIYHHEDELHQDIPFPVQTSMGPVYFQCALSLLEECYTTSHRTTIRALLHLFMYHVHDKPEDAFPYCDLAVRMTLDLNLHKKQQHDLYDYYQQHSEQQQQQHNEDNNNIINSNGYSNKQIQAEDDRRLWWAAYWCQLYTIVEYNRPTVIEDEEIEIPMPRKLSFENMDVGYCIDYCSLSIKLLRLRRSIAKALKSSDTTHALLYQVRDLETSLDEWYTDLPEHAKLPSSSSSSSQQQQQQQDTLSTELGLLLHAQYYSIKLQMYECFLNNATALSLVAVNNCAKAAAGITKMLVQYGSTMRMCSCVRIVPTLYRCVTMLKYNAKFKESDGIASNAVEHLRMLGSILRCHSFKYLQEISAVIGLIDKTLELYPSIKTSPKPIVPATKSSLQPQQPSPSSVQSNIETTENINYQHQQHKMDYHLTSTHNNASAVSNQQQQQQPYSFQSHHDTSISTVKQQSMNAMRHTLSTDTSSIQTQPTLPSSSITNMSHQSNTKKRQCNRQTITTNDLTNTPISSNKESFSTSSTSQMQQMAAPINGIGGFNMEQFSQEHRMNAYQQNIAPPPPSTTSSTSMGSQQYGQSFPISTLTSSISDNNNDTHMTSFPQQQQQTSSTTTTLQQSSSSTDQAWTTSIPMNPETLALLGITNTGTISFAPSQPQEHFNNNILSQQSSIPSLESNNNNNNINNTQMYDSQPCTHHQDHQQQQSCMKSTFSSDNNGSNNNNRSSPFSQGSIFHRAPAVSRPSFNHTHSNNDVLIEDPYLTKFPLITPPIIASSLYQQQQQQQQNYAIITELPPNLTTDDSTSNSGSNTTHFDTTSSSSHPSSSNNSITSSKSSSGNNNNNSNQRSTIQSPDSNNNYEFNTSFYQSIPFSSTSSDIDQLSFSSSSHHDQRRSPSNPPQQHYYFS